MMKLIQATALCGIMALAACSNSDMPPVDPPEGQNIVTPGIQSYTTNHNGYTRARINNSTGAADDRIIAQFEDGNPTNPAGYRNLIELTESRYRDNMQIEVIAQVTTVGGEEQVVRILRMTADQAPFDNIDRSGNTIASGEFFFRGRAEVYANVDGGPLQRGVGDLENMVVNFDTESVFINLRTPFNPGGGSDIETEINVDGVPLNIVTGEFGGPVTMTTRSATTGEIITTNGVLRGNLNGDAENLSRQIEDMTTSGLFTIGNDRSRVQADGVFWGSQLNYPD